MRLSAISLALGRGGQRSIAQRGLASCRRNSAPVLAPLPGYVFSDVAGTTPATIDGTGACLKDNLGGSLVATNPTAGQQPIWRKGAVNLLTYSEDFSNASWTKDACTVSGKQIIENGATANHRIGISVSGVGAGLKITFHADLKRQVGTRQVFLQLIASGGSDYCGKFFNLDTIALGSTQQNGTAVVHGASITDIGGGLYRCSVTATVSTSAALSLARVCLSSGTTVGSDYFAGDSASSLYVDHTMLEVGGTASQYVATTSAPASNGVGPYWLDSDTVDDKLITVAGAAYSAATVIKSIKGVGHLTSHAQDISASTNWTDDNLCGLILSPAQPSAADLALMERYADYLAGV